MRQVLRSRRLEGRLLDFSPGRKSQYEIYAKVTKEVLASKVRKEERTKECIIKLLAILSLWMLKVSTKLTKELLSPKVLIIIIIIIIVFIQYLMQTMPSAGLNSLYFSHHFYHIHFCF